MKWKPIKSLPFDTPVLLSYIGSDGETAYVNQGMRVALPHTGRVESCLARGEPAPTADKPRYVVAYIAIMEHGGAHNGHSFKARDWTVEPTHWQPLPKPCKATKP